ncbi:hypothetical protein HMPREF9074_07810 [Capnocytophaga sp. oral taxon 329 str. F0087]|nr:hypothetical protein HMPREF9074_07810 [Capnocytophaga sp. oral taxon 329 str. F0087]
MSPNPSLPSLPSLLIPPTSLTRPTCLISLTSLTTHSPLIPHTCPIILIFCSQKLLIVSICRKNLTIPF